MMKILTKCRVLSFLSILFIQITLNARPIPASFVMDAHTGEVLHASNAERRVIPASLTKMMTIYMLFESLREGRSTLDTPLYVSAHAAAQIPCKLFLKRGTHVSVRRALLGMIVKSANDASVAVAEHLGGSESKFAQMMTHKAHQLGMTQTLFYNCSGVPNKRQITTARDMAILAQALIRDFPEYYHYFSTPTIDIKGRAYKNHNKLLGRVQGVDGIKTGYTNASGFNLTTSAVYNNRRIIAVVMGGTSGRARDAKMHNLIQLAFNRRESQIAPQFKKRADVLILAQGKPKFSRKSRLLAAHTKISTQTNWAIQVGAFRSLKKAKITANRALGHIKLALGIDAKMQLLKVRRGNITQPRLLAMTESQAKSACRALRGQKMSCMPMKLTGKGRLA